MKRRATSCVAALAVCLWAPAIAHAWDFPPYSVLLSGEAGPQWNVFRLQDGSRKTPQAAATGAFSVDVTLYSNPWLPHRVSAFGGLAGLGLGSPSWPSYGVRPGLTRIPNPGVLDDPAAGMTAFGGVRYRWETGMTLVPFLEGGAFAHGHKVFRPGPPHLNVGVFGGGGLEYYVLHKVALFGTFRVQTAPLLWPLPYLVPWPEAGAQATVGVRFRAF